MKNIDIDLIKKAELFQGMTSQEISAILDCLPATVKKYPKGSFILQAGDIVRTVGIVLKGRVGIEMEDYWGNRNILTSIEPGVTFAESYACAQDVPLRVSIEAVEDSEVLWLNVKKVLTTCSNNCTFHNRLIRNMVNLLATKNLFMNHKLTFLTQRSTREKLLTYLYSESVRQHTKAFAIPFDRQQLADFLSVDRSAMSNELSKLRNEGILEFNKNHFNLLSKPK
jgi:CRP-like cAMP-binding protein